MLRLGKSDEEFQEIYRIHQGGVRRTLQGMTGNSSIAEELTQEAFIKAWKGLPLFGFQSSLKTWLYKVAINIGRDWLRTHKHHSLPESHSIEEKSEASAETQAIQEALQELQEETRTLLVLHYYEGMKLLEISKVLEVPVGTIKSRLHGAKRSLQKILMEKGFNV